MSRAADDELIDRFAARAAHVLGTGVGVADGYAVLLRERHADGLGDEGAATLQSLQSGLGRVRLFVDDLLELSGLPARPVRADPVDATAVAAAAARDLAEAMRAAAITVDIGALPAVTADRALLERLVHHVLRAAGAAIGRGPGRIAVTGTRDAGGVRIEVRDDGPPLAAADADRLFDPFAMARGGGPLAGAGVSLAICRRIAERHRGSASASPGADGGATITIVLPEAA